MTRLHAYRWALATILASAALVAGVVWRQPSTFTLGVLAISFPLLGIPSALSGIRRALERIANVQETRL